ncbi:MAG TPA: ATP-binding protein [Planctomycetota bacterium]|jgi:signal transduction histidine kinase
MTDAVRKESTLPLGRRISLLVALITVVLAFLLQIVAMLVSRSQLVAAQEEHATSVAALMIPDVEWAVLTTNTHQLPAIIENVKRSNKDLVYMVVCKADGSPLAHSMSGALPGELDSFIRSHATPGPAAQLLNVRTERGDVLHLVQPLEGGTAGYMHLGLSWAGVDAAIGRSCQRLVVAMLIGLAFSTLIAWVAYRRLARPIVELTNAARRFGESDLSTRVPEHHGVWDETVLLAQAFNQMAGRLQDQVRDLMQSRAALDNEKTLVRAILDGMIEPVIVAEPDGRIVYCNHAARGLWEQAGTPPFETYVRLRSNFPEALRVFEAVAGGRTASSRLHQRVSGRDLATVVSQVLSPDGKLLGIIELSTDVTDQMRSWRALAHAEKLNVVGQLAAGVAHEINSPLDGAIEASRIIERSAGEADKVKRFAQAQRAGLERIAAIVRRLLTFSRLPGNKPRDFVAVPRLLEESQAILKHRLTHVTISLDVVAPSERELLIPGDELGLVQVLVNLLNNAIDVTPQGGTVKINVSTEGEFLRIAVTDQGPGIAEDVAAKLFTPFFTTKEVGKGTGLGLAVSSNIVEEHGGTIEFTNMTAPWGACFIVTLPLRDRTSIRKMEAPVVNGTAVATPPAIRATAQDSKKAEIAQ